MDDTLLCPICGSKMRNLIMNDKFCYQIGKVLSYIERSCHNKVNHYVQMIVDKSSKKVFCVKLPLNPQYSKTIEINFYKSECILNLLKDKISYTLNIPKIIVPDFPNLIKLKQQVNLYSLFS